MPTKRKTAEEAGSTPELKVPKKLLDGLVTGPMTQSDPETVFRSLKKAVIERAISAGMSEYLSYEPGQGKPEATNHRNGTSGKTVITDTGPVRIDVPGVRQGGFKPGIVGKHERRFTGFDDKTVAMYARGMTVREIQATCWRCTADPQVP
jgi:putative transposase